MHSRSSGAKLSRSPRSFADVALIIGFGALCAAGVEAALILQQEPPAPWVAVLVPAVALLYVAIGLGAWVRRPSSRLGALIVAGGGAWFLAGLANVDVPQLTATGLVTQTLPLAVIVHLLIGFPTGRLRDRSERLVVAAGYFVCLVTAGPALPVRARRSALGRRPPGARRGRARCSAGRRQPRRPRDRGAADRPDARREPRAAPGARPAHRLRHLRAALRAGQQCDRRQPVRRRWADSAGDPVRGPRPRPRRVRRRRLPRRLRAQRRSGRARAPGWAPTLPGGRRCARRSPGRSAIRACELLFRAARQHARWSTSGASRCRGRAPATVAVWSTSSSPVSRSGRSPTTPCCSIARRRSARRVGSSRWRSISSGSRSSCGPRDRGSLPPPTASAAGSPATSTTACSRGSSSSPSRPAAGREPLTLRDRHRGGDRRAARAGRRRHAGAAHRARPTGGGRRSSPTGCRSRSSSESRASSDRLAPEVETAAYFVVSEAIVNAVKHCGVRFAAGLARSHRRSAAGRGGRRRCRGRAGPAAASAGWPTGSRRVGGEFAFDSGDGGGTRVEAVIPCGS